MSLLSASDAGHAKINFRHEVRNADRLRRNGQCRVYRRRRGEERGVHYKQIVMIERSAEFIQSSVAVIASKARRTALVGDGEASHVLRDIELETDLLHQLDGLCGEALMSCHIGGRCVMRN